MGERLGEFLAEARRSSGMSVSRLAGEAQLGRRTLSRWEQGHTVPRIAELQSLLAALQAPPEVRRHALELLAAPRALKAARALDLSEHGVAVPSGGDLLRAMRRRRARTQDELAASLGVAQTTVARWEQSTAWPSPQTLRRLCAVLGALEEEVAALASGRYTLAGPATSETTPEALYERLCALQLPARDAEEHGLKDLRFFALEAQAAAHAKGSEVAQLLIADVYAAHARHLFTQERMSEITARCRRVLALVPADDSQRRVTATVYLAEAAMHPLTPSALREGFRLLRSCFNAPMKAEQRLWLMSVTAWALLRLGRADEAFLLARKGAGLLEQLSDGTSWRNGRHSLAGIFVRTGHAERALNLLQTSEDDPPDRRGYAACLLAEAMLDLGEHSESARVLTRARHDLDAYSLDFIRDDVEKQEARLG